MVSMLDSWSRFSRQSCALLCFHAVLVVATTAFADPIGGIPVNRLPNLTDNVFDLTGAPGPLSSVPVPTPPDLATYVRDVNAAQALGKMLFWDMQVGGDGKTACATCHWHAGADVRPRNTLSPHGPGTPISDIWHGANYQMKPGDYPFHKLSDPSDRFSTVLYDTSEITGSQGVIKANFLGIKPGSAVDLFRVVADPVFNIKGVNSRQVTGRNSPVVINAVYNDRQFWDGRANRYFNGVNPFGDTDKSARVWRYDGSAVSQVAILIDNGSLASQAVGPPNNDVEMSWNGRTFPLLGRKMLSLKPLALQKVHTTDSLLGKLANSKAKGLLSSVTYQSMIQQAFQPEWWSASTSVDGQFTQMEANFSLFWGLAIQAYESTLISDDSPYDRFAKGDSSAISNSAKQGLEIFLNQGRCISCHSGPEFAGGTVSQLRPIGGTNVKLIERMMMGNGKQAVYDNGFYNIGVRPTQEDLGVGANGPFGPFSYTIRRQQGQDIGDPNKVQPSEAVAVAGAFKTPTLRNVELTGPHFHNGGQATLMQVVEFYARGGDFNETNIATLDPDIAVIADIVGNPTLMGNVVDFLKALTDPRVEYQKPPFDHPELIVPNGHSGVSKGVAVDNNVTIPATGSAGGARLKRYDEILVDGVPN